MNDTTTSSPRSARPDGRGGLFARLRGRGGPSPRGREERGSALIISIMVMVILTMIGVTFLVLSEQEQRISVNSRDYSQAMYLAEAGVELGKTWFNDPTAANLLKPTNAQMNFSLRKGHVFESTWLNEDERALAHDRDDTSGSIDGSAGNVYTGGLQGSGGASRFEKNYRGTPGSTLYGRRDTPDVLICNNPDLDVDGDGTNDCNANMTAYMTRVNDALRMSTSLRADGHPSRDYGPLELEQIRVYRPPVDFTLRTRYGIATIEATAVKRVGGQVVARRTVREVIQEIPFPGPGGAIEADDSIGFGGNSSVHWGPVVDTSPVSNIGSLGTGANFQRQGAARSSSSRFGYHFTINPATFEQQSPGSAAPPPAVPRIVTFLTEALGVTRAGNANPGGTAQPLCDPWIMFKARNVITGHGNANQPHPFRTSPRRDVSITANDDNSQNQSDMFQHQIVSFPPIDYDTWKGIAQSGQQNMYYFKWVSGSTFKKDGIGPTQDWFAWLTSLKKGIFFFDTQDSKKPNATLSNLTPQMTWGIGNLIQGFVYCNSTQVRVNGASHITTPCNTPGEPFLDDGIDLHTPAQTEGDDCICLRIDPTDGKCVLGAQPIGAPGRANTNLDGDDFPCTVAMKNSMNTAVAAREAETFRNGIWDSDIDNDGFTDAGLDLTTLAGWSHFHNGADSNGMGGHMFAALRMPYYPSNRIDFGQKYAPPGPPTPPADLDWKRDPRFLNHCGDIFGGSADRQVTEPYLNFDSPTNGNTVGTWSPGTGGNMTTSFTAEGEVIERNSGGAAIRSTSVARDADGPLINLDLSLNGVWYNEGSIDAQGNFVVYGSMLMKGGWDSTGDVNVWYNEGLAKGKFPDPSLKLPRIFASGRDTN